MDDSVRVRPLNVAVRPHSQAERGFHARVVMPPEALAPGLPSTPAHDLRFHKGKTIPNLQFANFYVGGSQAWKPADIQAIDHALAAAMADRALNNVMVQYFVGNTITSTFRCSQVLAGPKPAVVSQGDVESLVRRLFAAGQLNGFALASTVFNFLLPSGTILTTDAAPTHGTITAHTEGAHEGAPGHPNSPIPHEEEDSTEGLGGYHGSIHIRRQHGTTATVYYAVGVFSERLPNGTENGIAVFDQPWKNVVATFYHELNEARTDPDVEDAIRAGNDPTAVHFLGWTSAQGEECGDFPVFEANPLSEVFKEVPLADGSGPVPVQFQYSDAAHGPEGPIPTPAPKASRA